MNLLILQILKDSDEKTVEDSDEKVVEKPKPRQRTKKAVEAKET